MKSTAIFFFTFLLFWCGSKTGYSQPFTKKYIMSFHTCDANCTGYQDHIVQLAESDDGMTWTLVPNFIPYKGSVPDVIIRGSKLYIYTPGMVKRYDNSTNSWDSDPVPVSIVDNVGNHVNYVDPSSIVDKSGRIVLFFLNSTGINGDPAGCQTYPCTKYFDSATEKDGTDGTQFVMQSGDRKIITLNNSPITASDPDIYFDETKYILYISKGSNTIVFNCDSLHGTYSSFPNLSGDVLTNQGGIPSGYYDEINKQYWTFIHAQVSGNTVIKRAVHSDFNSQLTNFSTVVSGTIIGEPPSTKTESPGFCINTFLTTEVELNQRNIPTEYKLFQNYPNPFNPVTTIKFTIPEETKVTLEVFNQLGERVAVLVNEKLEAGNHFATWNAANLPSGIYFYEIRTDKFSSAKKLLLLK